MFSDVKELELADGAEHQLRFQMSNGVRVEGRLDGPVARPVKSGRVIAEVIVSAGNDAEKTLDWRVTAKMRLDGSFIFESVPPGELQVIALCDGAMAESGSPPPSAPDEKQGTLIRPQVFKIDSETNNVVLKMTPTAECLIHVRDPDGRPVAGAKCGFWPNVHWWNGGSQIYCEPLYDTLGWLNDPPKYIEWMEGRLFSGSTDDNGDVVVKNLPPKERQFSVRHDKWRMPLHDGKREAHVELSGGQRSELTLTLETKQ